MGINVTDFRTWIVNPALELCEQLAAVPNTSFARDLVVATAAQETALGLHLHQSGRGDAISIYQFEPATLDDLLRNFASSARFAPLLYASQVPNQAPTDQIMWNLRFATVCCRLNYYRVREPLPKDTTFDGLWHYYKQYWNSELGAATPDSFRAALKLTDIRL